MTKWIKKNVATTRLLELLLLLALGALVADNVHAGSVAQVMEKKTLPDATIAVIDPETGTSSGSGGIYGVKIDVGDIILFKFAMTPAPYQEFRGIQSYLTEYIPENTEVVGVRITDADGNTITPRYPGLANYGCKTGCPDFTGLPCTVGSDGCSGGTIDLQRGSIAQVHADTGIFYAADTETRLARNPGDQFITMDNGTVMNPQPVYVAALIDLLDAGTTIYAHNAWDWTQVRAYGISTAASGNSGKGETPFGYGSEVAGPETYYPYEATDVGGNVRFNNVVGPWHRIRYPGSKIGTGPADAGELGPDGLSYTRAITDPVGSQIGWDATPMNAISAGALRFALGDTRVGSAQFVEVALRVLALPLDPNFGGGPGEHVNCGEVVGTNIATRRTGSVLRGEENPWSAYLGSPSCVYLRLLLDLTGSTDLAVLQNVNYTLRTKNLSVNDETNVRVELRWDDTEINYSSTDSGPPPDGATYTCTDDSSSTCLNWTIGTLAPSDELNLGLTFAAKGSGGRTGNVTVRYYSDQLPAPGYYTTRDIYVQQQVPSPTATLAPVADPTVTAASAGGTYALSGTLKNVGNYDGNFKEVNPVLPSGWSLASNRIVINGVNVTCTSTIPDHPVCGFTDNFTPGETRTLAMTVNVPSGEATDLYDLDVQLWMEEVETYFDHIATVPVGAVRTQKPVLDCPIGSTDPAITGTSEDNADVTLYFNLMERGFANEADNGSGDGGAWEISDYDYFAPPNFGDLYGGLEVSAIAQVTGKLPSERSDRCDVEPKRQCSDGLDNDGDGEIDFPADTGCDSPSDNDESNDPQCSDGIDNNSAGGTDWPADPSCYGPDDPTEDGIPACSDGVDNDGDGAIDYPDDPDCTSASDSDEATLRQCQNRIDDDSNGYTDFDTDPTHFDYDVGAPADLSDTSCNSPFDDEEVPISYTSTDVYGRILVVFDTSGSMNLNTCTDEFTGGDGSEDFPGVDVACDELPPECAGTPAATTLCDDGLADDSRMYQVKAGMTNVINSFGEVEFALMRYHQRPSVFQAPTIFGSLASGGWQGGGDAGTDQCGAFGGADVLVSFAPENQPPENQQSLLAWLDGKTNFSDGYPPPPSLDWELRGSGTTPLGGALEDALAYLTAVKANDPIQDISADCRPYRVVLVTDGLETCDGDPVAAAGALYDAGFPVSVIAFSTADPTVQAALDEIAAAGNPLTPAAISASDQVGLSAAFAEIITDSIKYELCNGADDDCDGDTDEDFTDLDNDCDNGLFGECFATGTIVCTADQLGTECNAPIIAPGVEICNLLDDDCNGIVDDVPGGCPVPTPEICNGIDDDLDGVVDASSCVAIDSADDALCNDAAHNLDPVACAAALECEWYTMPGEGAECGLSLGECTPGNLVCVSGALECQGGTSPSGETCNGLDDNCDGIVDAFTEECYTGAWGCPGGVCEGLCRMGLWTCNDSVYTACLGEVTPIDELCNGLDDDCDGLVDVANCVDDGAGAICDDATHNLDQVVCEAETGCRWAAVSGVGVACGTDVGECQAGSSICTSGAIVCDGAVGPTTDICNTLDDDCDGTPDQGFGDLGDVCDNGMLGNCAASGNMVCRADGLATVCDALPGTPVPEVCNGEDDDCDGEIDGFVEECYSGGWGCTIGGSCTGECQTGVHTCTDSAWGSCLGEVVPTDELCNGLDDDCDSMIDVPNCVDDGAGAICDDVDHNLDQTACEAETGCRWAALPGVGDNCGTDVGLCEFGQNECTGGGLVCVGGTGPVTDICDGFDNDCDGTADQGYTDLGAVCDNGMAGECLVTGHMVCRGDHLATVCDAAAGTPQAEICDDKDNDCDGVVDQFVEECYTGGTECVVGGSCTGECRTGSWTCTAGAFGTCMGEVLPTDEVCNGRDDDCDGLIDVANCVDDGAGAICDDASHNLDQGVCEAETGCRWVAIPGVGDDCGSDVGECSFGHQECVGGGLVCVGATGPVADICNGLDDDCDGTPDQAYTDLGAVCDNGMVGECYASGHMVCRGDGLATECDVGPGTPVDEICDDKDNDCDGVVDGFVEECYTGAVGCTVGDSCTGECQTGTWTCTAGAFGTCDGEVLPADEVCNGLDDDCDGLIDVANCVDDGAGAICDDASHNLDQGVCEAETGCRWQAIAGVGDDCGSDVGECSFGHQECVGGALVCVDAVGPVTDICDYKDNDCDGVADQTFTDLGADCDNGMVGACAASGTMVCRGDGLATECSAGPGTPVAEECNNIDDNCDGVVDNFSQECYTDTDGCVVGGSCVGECQTGVETCTAGGWGTCVGEVTRAPEVCNGLDDDCDGNVDQGVLPGVGDPCTDPGYEAFGDTGECEFGAKICSGGALVCDGYVGPVPDVCDGLDNDCDGEIDEDFPDLGTACDNGMVGACYNSGVMVCRPDHLATECSVGPGTPTPETCNNIDDDCDGVVDHFLVQCYPYSSGCEVGGDCVGSCRLGVQDCTAGVLGECTGAVGPATDVCNGLDDDCDGTADEDFPDLGDACTSGSGNCITNGEMACTLDGTGTYCTAPVVIIGDEFCNGLDDDCDGDIDEPYCIDDGAGDVCGDASHHDDQTACEAETGCRWGLPTPIGDVCGATGPGCTPGAMECVDGLPTCVGAEGGVPEVCNGLDDDCDLLIDEPVLPEVGDPCTDPGYESIGDTGECEFGGKICVDGALICDGYVGPTDEICDGLDNDCDGETDNFAICPDPDNLCFESVCVVPCEPGEFPCPAGFLCEDIPDEGQYCVPNPCVDVTCDPGFIPVPDGLAQTCTCTDLCDTVTCQPGEVCTGGFCFDCFDPGYGCDEDEVCTANDYGVGECQPDPCANAGCSDDEYCQDGQCCPAACDPPCPNGVQCNLDNCQASCEDPCADVECPNGKICNPNTGECQSDHCIDVTCGSGRICRPSDGQCIPDPCLVTNCPTGTACEITVDGEATCKSTSEAGEEILAAGGGGCSVQLGSGSSTDSGLGRLIVLLLGALFVWRRRRGRR